MRCTARSFYPFIWAAIGTGLLLWAVLAAQTTVPVVTAFVAGFGMIVFAIREWRHPAVLFEVTNRGVLLYAFNEGLSGSFSILKDMFIPWERVEEMRFIDWRDLRPSRTGRAGGNWPVIAIKLRADGQWPAQGTMRNDFWTRPVDVIYVDAFSGSPHGARLFAEMKAIQAQSLNSCSRIAQ